MEKCYICGKNNIDENSVTIYAVGTDKVKKICDECLIKEMELASKWERNDYFVDI